MSIPFTQFVLPNGERRRLNIEYPGEWMAHELITQGWKFEIEILRTGEVSMEVCREGEEDHETLAHELCDNGLDVTVAVDKLVKEAYSNYKNNIQM